jgi:hypothetical protein
MSFQRLVDLIDIALVEGGHWRGWGKLIDLDDMTIARPLYSARRLRAVHNRDEERSSRSVRGRTMRRRIAGRRRGRSGRRWSAICRQCVSSCCGSRGGFGERRSIDLEHGRGCGGVTVRSIVVERVIGYRHGEMARLRLASERRVLEGRKRSEEYSKRVVW